MLKRLLFSAIAAGSIAAASAQTVWSEDFEGGTTLPAGWSQTTLATDGGWLVGAGPDLSSSAFPIPGGSGNVLATNDDGCNCDKSADIVKMPVINLSAYTALYLTYDIVYGHSSYGGDTEALDLMVTTDGGTTWTAVYALPGAGGWKYAGYNISAYAGQAAVQFAFRYNDNGGWLYGAAIDNIKIVVPDNIKKSRVSNITFGRNVDAIPAVLGGYDKFWAGENMAIGATMENTGFVTISSFDATWTRGAQTATKSYTGLSIGFAESYDFAMDVPTALGANTGDITVSITNIDGGVDNDPSDNVGSVDGTVEGVEPVAGRKVVVEEATGTWCQWCPRGAVMMDYISEKYPDIAAPIAVHNQDPMVVGAYNTGMVALIGGFPSGLVNRTHNDVDPTTFEKWLIEEMTVPPAVLVSHDVNYDEVTRKATVESHINFQQALDGDYRVLVVFTQDSVKGTGSTYAQVNAYSGGGSGPMGGFESLAGTVPAAQIQYDHVGRALIGGFAGAAGSIPAANPAGSEAIFTSEYTIPSAYKVNKMHAITIVLDNATGQVVNAETTAVPFDLVSGSHEPAAQIVSMSVAPNPVSDVATVTLNLKEVSDIQLLITDMTGQTLIENNFTKMNGEQQIPVRVNTLPAGTYMLMVNAKGKSVVAQQLVIVR